MKYMKFNSKRTYINSTNYCKLQLKVKYMQYIYIYEKPTLYEEHNNTFLHFIINIHPLFCINSDSCYPLLNGRWYRIPRFEKNL